MSVVRLNDLSSPQLADQWNALAGGVPFRSFQWLANWWKLYEPGWTSMRRQVELFTLAVYDGQTPIAFLPCYLERSKATGRVVQFLGARETCSDYLSLLCRPGCEAAAVNELADWLAAASRKSGPACDRWDILQLNGVDAADPLMARLIEQLQLRGLAAAARAKDRTWRIELPSTWEKYLELLSKSHRKQLRQRQRRAFDSGQVRLCTAGPLEGVERGWNILTELHQRRLESLGKAGCFASSVYKEFHHAATRDLFSADMLRLHWIELEGQPVAAEYHLKGSDVVYAYQGGVAPEALDHEPGRLATMATVQLAIEHGFRGFDFCRGDEAYKAHWRATPRESLEWRVVSNHAAAKVRDCVWVAGDGARRFIKSGLSLAGHKRSR